MSLLYALVLHERYYKTYFIVALTVWHYTHSKHIVIIGKRRFGPGRKLIYGVQRNLIIYIIEIINIPLYMYY